MSLLCCVRGCSNGTDEQRDPEAMFFPFPNPRENQGPRVEALTRKRRMAWVSAVKRPSITFDHVSPLSYVCSRHFHKGQPSYETLDTDPDWAPSLHLGRPQPTITKKSKDIGIKSSKQQTPAARQRKVTTASFLIQNECCVVDCGSRSHNDRGQRIRNGLAFFPFPVWKGNCGVFMSDLSKRQREAWVKAIGRADITFDDVPDDARVCSRHFVSGKPAYEMKEKDPDWAPSLHLSNGEPQRTHIRNPRTARKRTMKNKSNQTVTHGEKPSTVPLKTIESDLQELERPMEMPPVVDDSVQNFKDAFRNALKASLDACVDSSAQSPTESCLSFDPSWFSTAKSSPQSSVLKQLALPCASTVSEAHCENCVLLQERITKLEERLGAPQFLQGYMDQSEKPCPSYKHFMEYRSSKSKERQSSNYGPRGKHLAKERKPVQINIGLMVPYGNDGTDLKPLRGKSLQLHVDSQVEAPDLLKQAVKKMRAFNKDLQDGPYVLLYPDCSEVIHLPGSEKKFKLADYKKEIGKQYHRINLFICLKTHFNEAVGDMSNRGGLEQSCDQMG